MMNPEKRTEHDGSKDSQYAIRDARARVNHSSGIPRPAKSRESKLIEIKQMDCARRDDALLGARFST